MTVHNTVPTLGLNRLNFVKFLRNIIPNREKRRLMADELDAKYSSNARRPTGIPISVKECQTQVNGYPGAVFKGFPTRAEADDFSRNGSYGRPSQTKAVGCHSGHSVASNARQRYSKDFVCHTRSQAQRYSAKSSSSSEATAALPVVYTDGSCFKNGYCGAKGGIGVYWGEGHTCNLSEKLEGHQTNQRAEIVSACRALESAIEQGLESVELRTDSMYTIKLTDWIPKWKRNGWQTVTSQDVKNKEDIQRLDQLCQRICVKWTHVPGHNGVPGNEAADHLAKAGSLK